MAAVLYTLSAEGVDHNRGVDAETVDMVERLGAVTRLALDAVVRRHDHRGQVQVSIEHLGYSVSLLKTLAAQIVDAADGRVAEITGMDWWHLEGTIALLDAKLRDLHQVYVDGDASPAPDAEIVTLEAALRVVCDLANASLHRVRGNAKATAS